MTTQQTLAAFDRHLDALMQSIPQIFADHDHAQQRLAANATEENLSAALGCMRRRNAAVSFLERLGEAKMSLQRLGEAKTTLERLAAAKL